MQGNGAIMTLGKTKINHKEIDKMKKIILLACLFVCMILVFASCADKAEEMDAKTFCGRLEILLYFKAEPFLA